MNKYFIEGKEIEKNEHGEYWFQIDGKYHHLTFAEESADRQKCGPMCRPGRHEPGCPASDRPKLDEILEYLGKSEPKYWEVHAKKAKEDIETLFALFLDRQKPDGLTAFEFERLILWMKDPKRKSAETAFTSGACRDAARCFERSGVVDRQKKLERVVEMARQYVNARIAAKGNANGIQGMADALEELDGGGNG